MSSKAKVKRTIAVAFTSALLLGVVSTPAFAINDIDVPANECSGENPNVVGTPGGAPNPGLAVSEPVGPPASENNPGQSPGAQAADVLPELLPCLAA